MSEKQLVVIIQNWFARLPMTKQGNKKAVDFGDCKDLIRQLSKAESR